MVQLFVVPQLFCTTDLELAIKNVCYLTPLIFFILLLGVIPHVRGAHQYILFSLPFHVLEIGNWENNCDWHAALYVLQ